jgi:hypothetical protein
MFSFDLALGGSSQGDYSGSMDDGWIFDFSEMDVKELSGIFLDAYDIGQELLARDVGDATS